MARRSFYTAMGILVLALAYHLSATRTEAQSGGAFVGVTSSGGPPNHVFALTDSGDLYWRALDNWVYRGNYIVQTGGPIGGGFVGVSSYGTVAYALTASGDLYRHWHDGFWLYDGNYIDQTGGPTGGGFVDVGVGPGPNVYALTASGDLYRHSYVPDYWVYEGNYIDETGGTVGIEDQEGQSFGSVKNLFRR